MRSLALAALVAVLGCASGTGLMGSVDPCNGLDDDRDGRIDEGNICRPGFTQTCDEGGVRRCTDACRLGPCETLCLPGDRSPCERCGERSCLSDGTWGECGGAGECEAGEMESCGDGTTSRLCSTSCEWSMCSSSSCSGAEERPCGNCGVQRCVSGEFGECESQGECGPGEVGACGFAGNRTCDASCAWGECADEGECIPRDSRACGDCGVQLCGDDSRWAPCSMEGECTPGSDEACGAGGRRSCTVGCAWSDCEGEGCSEGDMRTCGFCGTQTCDAAADWGMCAGSGACAPGTEVACGLGGTQTCDSDCTFGPCEGEGECAPGAVEGCGRCGSRTCGAGFMFGACAGEGTCVGGTTEVCGMNGMRTCSSASCEWGACMGEGECSAGETRACGLCGTQTCSSGAWGTCTGGGVCTPGTSAACGIMGSRTCDAMCAYATCSSPESGLHFNSAGSDTVRLQSGPAFGTGPFTIEAWVRASGTQTVTLPAVISTRDFQPGPESKIGWRFGIASLAGALGRLYIGADENVWFATAGADLRDDSWHHVAVARSGTSVAFYIDGVPVVTRTISPETSFSAPDLAHIGNDTALLDTPFNGRISDLRVWDRQLSATSIRDGRVTPVSTTGLVARWRLDGTGQVVEDSVGPHDGVLGTTTAVEGRDPARVALP